MRMTAFGHIVDLEDRSGVGTRTPVGHIPPGFPVRLTAEPDGRICLESGFQEAFVAHLKDAIPWTGRAWVGTRKRWLISPLYATELLAFLRCHQARVQDERQRAAPAPLTPADYPPDFVGACATLYVVLEAPYVVAEASWKALSRLFHPDNQSWGDHEKSVALNAAWGVFKSYVTPPEEEI